MSLDNIQLNPVLLEQLYPKSLVIIKEQENEAATAAPVTTSISSLGNNEKNILVVVNEPGAAFLNDADFSSLVKILSAVQLSPADIALVNHHTHPGADFNQLNNSFKPSAIILLGVSPTELGFPLLFPHYQLTKYNGQTYLAAPSLTQMAGNKETKTQFWNAFKTHFSS